MKIHNIFPVLFLSLLLLASASGSAQQFNENESLFSQESQRNTTDFGLQLGSSFTTGFGSGSMFSQSVAPNFNWNINQRWSLTAGTVFTSTQLNGFSSLSFPGMNYNAMPDRMFGTTLYVLGAYRINERLTLTGGTWVERNNMQQPLGVQMNPGAFNLSGRGMMMGMDYRITENFHFGAELRMSSGYNPFNPFHNQGSFNRGSTFPRNW